MKLTKKIENYFKNYLAHLKEQERRNLLIKRRFIRLQCKTKTRQMERIEWVWEQYILPAHIKHREKILGKKIKK